MSAHDAAPYQLLVDHIAAASEGKLNTSIECPPKPQDYTCPIALESQSKEELKKKVCEYDNIIVGRVELTPEAEKATTRCGSMKVSDLQARQGGESSELPQNVAVLVGKDCPAAKLVTSVDQRQQQQQGQLVYVLVKGLVPSGTKLVVLDGASMALVPAQDLAKEDLLAMMKQCPVRSFSQVTGTTAKAI